MKICVNWLPSSLAATAEIANLAESVGLWGIGIGDSPHYSEIYSASAVALSATENLVITTCVTNPVTRHWSVHAAAAKGLSSFSQGRFRLGLGRGDSAVRTFGLEFATVKELESILERLSDRVDVPILLAASGSRTTHAGARFADGVIAGVGRHPADLARTRAKLIATASEYDRETPEMWATIRIAVTESASETVAMRKRLIPRAISASHFAFGSALEDKNIPNEFHDLLRERYLKYDYSSHGKSGTTSNADLFSDHPEIEDYLLDRFAIVGEVDYCRAELDKLSNCVDGVFLSLVFEDASQQIERIGAIRSVE